MNAAAKPNVDINKKKENNLATKFFCIWVKL